jgi:hypothetical protein
MLSPMTLVVGLTVMWLIVVVPMIVRRPAGLGTAQRRRVPTAEEASVHNADHPELSDARRQMIARRRRSLTILIAGCALSAPLALMRGGVIWPVALAFVGGLAGYLYFLRGQARRDRERRAERENRAASRRGWDVEPVRLSRPAPMPGSAVPIDDDDLALQSMDTMDLTGLYDETTVVTAQRRAG